MDLVSTLYRKWWLPICVKYMYYWTGQKATDNQSIINAQLAERQYFDMYMEQWDLSNCFFKWMGDTLEYQVLTIWKQIVTKVY